MNETILESFYNDFAQVRELIRALGQKVRQDISDYPIFIASNQPIPIGTPAIDPEQYPLNWIFYASTLEEFLKRNLIKKENAERFRRTYGDSDEKACVFVISDSEQAQFIFVPYKGKEEME